jgi:hypothetical protein
MPADQHGIREFGRRTYPGPSSRHGGFGPRHVHSGHAVPAGEQPNGSRQESSPAQEDLGVRHGDSATDTPDTYRT